jgi:hypothetical protein
MALTEVKQTFVRPFMEGLTQPDSSWQNGFDVWTDDVAAVKLAAFSGIGTVPVWDGTNDYPQADVNDRANTTLTYTKYALQVRINEYDAMDVPRIVSDAASKLGNAIANTYGSIAAARLADCFNVTTTSGDGVALCSDSHPTASGALRDSKLTSSFDRTAYMAAVNLASLWQSYHNLDEDWSADPKILFASPQATTFREDAFEVFGSALSGSDMQANAAASFRPEVNIWAKLTDSTQWFVMSKLRKPLVFWIRKGAESTTKIDEDNGNIKISTSFAIGTIAKPDPVGIIGSDT